MLLTMQPMLPPDVVVRIGITNRTFTFRHVAWPHPFAVDQENNFGENLMALDNALSIILTENGYNPEEAPIWRDFGKLGTSTVFTSTQLGGFDANNPATWVTHASPFIAYSLDFYNKGFTRLYVLGCITFQHRDQQQILAFNDVRPKDMAANYCRAEWRLRNMHGVTGAESEAVGGPNYGGNIIVFGVKPRPRRALSEALRSAIINAVRSLRSRSKEKASLPKLGGVTAKAP